MRKTLPILLLVLLSSGCARKVRPPVPAPAADQPAAIAMTDTGEDGGAEAMAAQPMYQGRTAPQWADRVRDTNHAVQSRESVALAQLGEKGYPYLMEGMRSRSDQLRLNCLRTIDKSVLVTHSRETLPVLTQMLRDPKPTIRRAAAARLCWYGPGAQTALRELQTVADSDPLPDIRDVARLSIQMISKPDERSRSVPQDKRGPGGAAALGR